MLHNVNNNNAQNKFSLYVLVAYQCLLSDGLFSNFLFILYKKS